MSFGISNNVRSRVVRECTPGLFWQTVRLPLVGRTCAEIEDAWEKAKRGEIHREEFEQIKASLKKKLPIFTFHATFKNGRRLNAEAIPSGLSMYDIDHLPDPRGYWGIKNEELKMKNVLRFVALVHVTPSGEGLRLVFIIPQGMDLASAQKWMSEQLGDANYDPSVKDLARSSFAVPEEYILYINEERLFSSSKELKELEGVKGVIASSKELKELEELEGVKADTLLNTNQSEELKELKELEGVKADTLCLYYPRHSALTPLTPTNSSNSSKDNS